MQLLLYSVLLQSKGLMRQLVMDKLQKFSLDKISQVLDAYPKLILGLKICAGKGTNINSQDLWGFVHLLLVEILWA